MTLSKSLLKRKRWYTLEDAAKRINIEADTKITTKDLFQFALDEEIMLSVIIQHQAAQKVIKLDEPIRLESGEYIDAKVDAGNFHRLDGIYDLKADTEATQVKLTSWIINDPEYGLNFGSWEVIDPENPENSFQMYDAIECADGYERLIPAGPVPDLSRVVVKRESLDTFIANLAEETPEAKSSDDAKTLEAMGLLVETYVNERGPSYRHGEKPNVSRIVDEMLDIKPDDVTKMSRRKLQDIVSDALKAWEAKKRT